MRAAVLQAAEEALVDAGLAGLDLTDVAERAGVGKSTVYRRWGTVAGLITDVLHDMAERSVSRADTGSLRGDLRANAALVRKTLADRRQGRLLRAFLGAAATDDATARALAVFYDRRVAEWARCVDDAVARGEAPAGIDAEAVIRQVSAPLYYQFLTTTAPLTARDATRAADAALAAVDAGVFGRGRSKRARR